MKKLLLHVGTHKTGTTAIQHALFTDRERLAAAGILYEPDRPASQRGPRNAHHWVAHALARDDAADRDALRAYRDRMQSAAADTILLSAEPFYRHADMSCGANPRDRDQFLAARATYLERVATYFAPFDMHLSIYFRRPDRYVDSLYKENAASNNLKISFAGYRAASPPCFLYRYQDRLDELRRYFDKIAVHCFENARKTGLVNSFYADHDLPAPPDDAAPGPLRGSVSLRAALWLVTAKQAGGLNDQDRKRRWLFALSDAGRAYFKSPVKEMFWKDEAERQGFVAEALSGFERPDFWTPAAETAAPVEWNDRDQAQADRAFADWQARNQGYLRRREALGLAPYMDDSTRPSWRARLLRAAFGVFSR